MTQKNGAKVGRNKHTCLAYKTANRRTFNKARKIMRHLRGHPCNQAAWRDLERIAKDLFLAQRTALALPAFLTRKGN